MLPVLFAKDLHGGMNVGFMLIALWVFCLYCWVLLFAGMVEGAIAFPPYAFQLMRD